VSESVFPYSVSEIKEDTKMIPSVSSSKPQATTAAPTVDKSNDPKDVAAAKPEENNQPAAKSADTTAQKTEHAMEGQARQAQLDADLNNKVDDKKIDENAKQIKEKLSYSVTDWAVTDKEVKEVHDKLDTLSPAEYKAQIDRMQKDGVLGRYIDNMGDKEKKAFLDQGVGKGYLNGGQAKVADGPANPPAGPTLYDNKKDLPRDMRQLISDTNLESAKQYDGEYSKYMDRYNKELDKCKNPEDMRKLGQWAPKLPLGQEPGYSNARGDEFADKWAGERYRKTYGDKAAREHAMEKMFNFTGRRPAGDVFVEGELNAKVEYHTPGKTGAGYTVKAGGTAGTGDGVKGGLNSESQASQEFGPVKVGTQVKHKDGKWSGSVGVMGNEVKAKQDGTVEVKANLVPTSKDHAYGPYGSYNPSQADARFGAYATEKAEMGVAGGKVKAEVGGKVGFGIRGITAGEVEEALKDGPGYFNDPVELRSGKSWNDLPKETQERYNKHYGWSEKEWQGKLPKYQPNAA
jgi:hypothetical protein